MDKNVFISKATYIPTKVKGFCKLKFDLFNRDNEKSSFYTSTMTDYLAKKYEKDALKLLGQKSWFDMVYGIDPEEFTPILGDDKTIVGLKGDKALLLRNEVTPINKIKPMQKEEVEYNL